MAIFLGKGNIKIYTRLNTIGMANLLISRDINLEDYWRWRKEYSEMDLHLIAKQCRPAISSSILRKLARKTRQKCAWK